jgi:CBS domain-containing protein
MIVRDLMHRGAECIGEDETLTAAAKRMRELDVGSLPICGKDDRLHGIITDRDIAIRCVAEGKDPSTMKAGELAQGKPVTVDSEAEIDAVLNLMVQHHIRRLPVIENHRLVGMVSQPDLARHLNEQQLTQFVDALTRG